MCWRTMRGGTVSKYDKQVWVRHPDDRTSKYDGLIDVYDVLEAFDVRCSAVQHAIKKLLQPGNRGHKGKLQDLSEAKESLSRAIEMEEMR